MLSRGACIRAPEDFLATSGGTPMPKRLGLRPRRKLCALEMRAEEGEIEIMMAAKSQLLGAFMPFIAKLLR